MKRDNIYRKRLDKHMDELKWLYMELYNSQDMFDGLLKGMEGFYKERAGCRQPEGRGRQAGLYCSVPCELSPPDASLRYPQGTFGRRLCRI